MRYWITGTPWLGGLVRWSRERVTPRGFFVLGALFVITALAVNLRVNQMYLMFCAASALAISAGLFALGRPPRVRVECRLPARVTAGTPLAIRASIHADRELPDLCLSLYSPHSSIVFDPPRTFLSAAPGKPATAAIEFRAARRGKYELPGVRVRGCDPLRLATTRALAQPPQALLVYPRYYSMESFEVPLGRRYQPGGIPLSSNTGDSIEFIGTRDYREGDPIRNIHWRSWARRGKPVVREFQEEYFCRIALILDTFVEPDSPSFEAAISVVASITDYFSRSEYVVDILAAGPDIYEVSAGRSLAYLENVLDVLACLEPCSDPPFATIAPHLFDKLEQITAVVAVMQDWDDARRDFLRQVKSLGAAVHAIVVHDGPTTKPWQTCGDPGESSQMSTADVEALLNASRKAS